MNTEKKGKFIISIDLEYGWGYWDHAMSSVQKEQISGETEVIHRLLSLFDLYEIPATWAVVGKLLEVGDDPLWHDTDEVVGEIRAQAVEHEIGSHSYAHIEYGESSREDVEKDVRMAREIHTKHDLSFDSFIFPRNNEGHHDLLKQYGITCYRGKTRHWYTHLPGVLGRLAHYIHYWIPFSRTITVSIGETGLINIPDSMLLLSRKGIRNFIPPSLMRKKAISGLRRAAERSEVFHLWFHPSNFSVASDTQFRILESILLEARRMREKGELETVTMGEVALQYERD